MKRILTFAVAVSALAACTQESKLPLLPAENFQTEINGKATDLYTLANGDITVQITNFGAHIVSIFTPDRNGVQGDVCPGYADIETYIDNPGERFMGCIVGPVANRIAKSTFTMNGQDFKIASNDGENTLHGGPVGLDKLVWDVEEANDSSITLSVLHPDGLDGWPGNIRISVKYTVTAGNELRLDYTAGADIPAPFSPSNHTFFNLTGDCSKTILDHELTINASRFTAIDNAFLATGEVRDVEGTPLDFRAVKAIGKDIEADYDQLANGHGYDQNWILDRRTENGLEFAAGLYDPESGRELKIYTDQIGFQFYSGNFFTGNVNDKYGKAINYRNALVFETQKWPGALNQASFPSIILNPGETYTHVCVYKFSAR